MTSGRRASRGAILCACLGVAGASGTGAAAVNGPRAASRLSASATDKPVPPAAERRASAPAGGTAAPAAAPPTPADRADTPARAAGAPGTPDLDKLRAEYDRLREELFKARVRSQKVSETVWPSKMDVRLRWKGGPDFVIRKARMLLDGAELWDSADRPQTDDVIEVSARSVKPGPHAFTVRLEVRPKTEAKGGTKTGADKLGYTSEHTFAIVVPDGGLTHLALTGDEDGNPPQYEPELELEIETDK